MIYETGLFDVSYAVAEGNSQRVFAAFGESDYMELSGLVVVDLREFREAPSVACRGGGRGCSAASSITARKRPQFL